MATNTGKGHRIGAQRKRLQVEVKNGEDVQYIKIDTETGNVIGVKSDTPYKGVAKHVDDRINNIILRDNYNC